MILGILLQEGKHVTDALVELVDVLPTLLELSGANQRVRPPSSLQGRSLLPLLEKRQPRHFRYAFTIAPRLLHATPRSTRGNEWPQRCKGMKVVLDGHASADLFFNGVIRRRVENLQCSDDLASGPFGLESWPAVPPLLWDSCTQPSLEIHALERWPLPTAPNRVWTVGEGGSSSERELLQYNTTDELADAGPGGQSEEVNLLYSTASQRNVQNVRAELVTTPLKTARLFCGGRCSAAERTGARASTNFQTAMTNAFSFVGVGLFTLLRIQWLCFVDSDI